MKAEDADAEVLTSVAVQLMSSGAVALEGQRVRVGKTPGNGCGRRGS
jgi:hypothetical protein